MPEAALRLFDNWNASRFAEFLWECFSSFALRKAREAKGVEIKCSKKKEKRVSRPDSIAKCGEQRKTEETFTFFPHPRLSRIFLLRGRGNSTQAIRLDSIVRQFNIVNLKRDRFGAKRLSFCFFLVFGLFLLTFASPSSLLHFFFVLFRCRTFGKMTAREKNVCRHDLVFLLIKVFASFGCLHAQLS